jgi:hypothetical protein
MYGKKAYALFSALTLILVALSFSRCGSSDSTSGRTGKGSVSSSKF